MDAIGQVLVSILANDSNVAALVSGRIFPGLIPQTEAVPAIVYSQISAPRDYTHSGASGIVMGLWQVTCWTESYSVTQVLADKVRDALSAYSGNVNDRRIQVIFVRNEIDLTTTEVEDITKYGKAIDFDILYYE